MHSYLKLCWIQSYMLETGDIAFCTNLLMSHHMCYYIYRHVLCCRPYSLLDGHGNRHPIPMPFLCVTILCSNLHEAHAQLQCHSSFYKRTAEHVAKIPFAQQHTQMSYHWQVADNSHLIQTSYIAGLDMPACLQVAETRWCYTTGRCLHTHSSSRPRSHRPVFLAEGVRL